MADIYEREGGERERERERKRERERERERERKLTATVDLFFPTPLVSITFFMTVHVANRQVVCIWKRGK